MASATKEKLLGMNVSSPSAAIGRQAAMETMILREAEASLGHFLRDLADRAWRSTVHPPLVQTLWENAVNDILAGIPKEAVEYMRSSLMESDLPGDVYSTISSIYATAAYAGGTEEDLRTSLRRALSPDGFEVEQISASLVGGRYLDLSLSMPFGEGRERAVLRDVYSPENLVAAGFWDSLQDTGSVWIKRIRRIVRTGATGLSGRLSITAIRLQDYEFKRWVTRHDDRVRHTHFLADGQTVPVDQPFIVGGVPLMYPGERGGQYGEIVQCRCVLTGVGKRR